MILIPLLTALIPFVPLATKLLDAKRDAAILKKTTGLTELSQGGYAAAIWLVWGDISSCSADGFESINCVTADHWGALCVVGCIAISNAVRKYRESK